MMSDTTEPDSWRPATEEGIDLFDNWLDPIGSEVRARARGFIRRARHYACLPALRRS